LEERKNRGLKTALKVMVTVPREFNRDRLRIHLILESGKKIEKNGINEFGES
jgi:hypothetical protein